MKTLFDKLWDQHVVCEEGTGAELLAVDRILLHERTGGVALKTLFADGYPVNSPSRVFCIMDHIVSFDEWRGRNDARSPGGEVFITKTREMAKKAGINLIDTDDNRQGIVHVVAPELGIAHPGISIVCADSHTCSLGALGALAIGVGSSESGHAMATGVIRSKKPKQMRVVIDAPINPNVTAKDCALHIISKVGAYGAKGRAVEFCGPGVASMSIEERLTLCNMAVEFGAFTAVIAPDAKTINFVAGRRYSPQNEHMKKAVSDWGNLQTDEGAKFDEELVVQGEHVNPMVSWGTSPEQASAINQGVPALDDVPVEKRPGAQAALSYMDLNYAEQLDKIIIDGAFIGSCTNGRISDLRSAASILKGRRIAAGVRAVCVPGSKQVRREAEAEGIDQIFRDAGFTWGAPGCAMCFYAGGATFPSGARVISSTNRNFEGRQGPGVRTHLASPATVAASAVAGYITAPEQHTETVVERGKTDENG